MYLGQSALGSKEKTTTGTLQHWAARHYYGVVWERKRDRVVRVLWTEADQGESGEEQAEVGGLIAVQSYGELGLGCCRDPCVGPWPCCSPGLWLWIPVKAKRIRLCRVGPASHWLQSRTGSAPH